MLIYLHTWLGLYMESAQVNGVVKKKVKWMKVDPEVHKVLRLRAVEEDIELEDLTSAVLERAIEEGLVDRVIEEEFEEEEEEEDEEEEDEEGSE
jgi:hypothetical protein